MGIRTTKSSSFIGRRHSLRPHRRQKLSIRRLIAFLIQYAQDQFYYIGAVVERDFKNCVRALRKGSKKLFAFLWRCICAVGRIIYKFSAAIFHDIAAPFKKAARSIKSLGIVLKSAKGRGFAFKMNRVKQFFKYGWLWNKHLVMRFFNYFLPVASLAVCVAVVITVVNLNYSLEVTYNGQQVGYVADSNVFDSACKIIQNRIIVKNDKTWSSDAELRIAVAGSEQLASQDVMANSLLSVSGTEIVEATGLYIGGVFQGATSAPALLQETLDEIIRPYKEQASFDPEIVVKFSRDVELIPGIYPAGSVKSIDDLLNLIRSPDAQDRYYEVSAGESAKEIALKNGLTLEKLQELNPDADMNLTEGTNLLIARAEPLLSIKTVKQLTYTESIAYETTAIKDSRFYVGYLWMVSTGEAGERTLTAEIEYENGEEISRTIISNVVTRPPINQEIIVGSKLQEGQTSVSVGTGQLSWPTGAGYSISRGWTSYHFGIDIAAAYGTPIYAADNGTVTISTTLPWDYGTYVMIDHGNGMSTVYGHNSANLVEVGDVVARGQLIGLMGSTGNSTGNHCHFEVRLQGVRVDPAIYLYG